MRARLARRAPWLIAVTVVLLAGVLSGCAGVDLPPGEYAVIPLDGQAITPGVYRYEANGQAYTVYLWDNLATPTPTATVTPSSTPVPTVTPPPPTQETTPPPPLPTLTPKPKLVCALQSAHPEASIAAINKRAGPFLDALKIGSIPRGSLLIVDQFASDSTYLWAHDTNPQNGAAGWVAVRERTTWWAWSNGENQLACLDRPGWPPGLDLPPAFAQIDTALVKLGPHLNVGASTGALIRRGQVWGLCKATQGAEQACYQLKAAYGTPMICRLLADAPTNWHDPAGWYSFLAARWPPGCDWYEAINEVLAPDWTTFADFHIGLMQAAEREGQHRCLLLFSFATGTLPIDADALAQLERVFDYLIAHPCDPASGRRHGIALHQPGYVETCPPAGCGWLNWFWTAGRDIEVFNILLDRRYHGQFEVIVTELGFADGYQGPTQPVTDCATLAAGVALTLRNYRDPDRIITGAALWNWSPLGGWIDYAPCTDAVADALARDH
jgi:hypothetical protein